MKQVTLKDKKLRLTWINLKKLINIILNMVYFIIVETYYKHGEYKLTILNNENKLHNFIDEKFTDYNIDKNYCNLDLDDKIERLIKIGNQRVNNQDGWGVREIRYIK